jgi:fructose-1,6-bisphosphatase
MFGFSASFQDSTIYVTDIQDVQGAWIESKTKFLLGRDNYSYQLKEHFTNNLQEPDRICMVFYATSKSKAEKIKKKLLKKYVRNMNKKSKKNWKPYDVRYITTAFFKFQPIDMSGDAQ